MDSNILSLEQADLGHAGHAVLRGVSLSLDRGDYLGIVGPNGAGKSTLLKSLLGVIPLVSGRILRPVPLRFGYVPQSAAIDDIFPLSVEDVVTSAADLRPDLPAIEVDRLLDEVGLVRRRSDRFHDLSGGQKQRVLLARAMAVDPDVLVLDEPTNGLDLSSEIQFMSIVDRLNARGRSVLLVTHMLNLVANHARRIAIVNHGSVVAAPVSQLLTDEAMRGLFGRGVAVGEIEGRRVVVAAAPPAEPLREESPPRAISVDELPELDPAGSWPGAGRSRRPARLRDRRALVAQFGALVVLAGLARTPVVPPESGGGVFDLGAWPWVFGAFAAGVLAPGRSWARFAMVAGCASLLALHRAVGVAAGRGDFPLASFALHLVGGASVCLATAALLARDGTPRGLGVALIGGMLGGALWRLDGVVSLLGAMGLVGGAVRVAMAGLGLVVVAEWTHRFVLDRAGAQRVAALGAWPYVSAVLALELFRVSLPRYAPDPRGLAGTAAVAAALPLCAWLHARDLSCRGALALRYAAHVGGMLVTARLLIGAPMLELGLDGARLAFLGIGLLEFLEPVVGNHGGRADYVSVGTVRGPVDAEAVRGRLGERGIPVRLAPWSLQSVLPTAVPGLGEIEVHVPSALVERDASGAWSRLRASHAAVAEVGP